MSPSLISSVKRRKEVAADLRRIYAAATAEEAEMMLGEFEDRWDAEYLPIGQSWRRNRTHEDLERYLKCFRCGEPTLDFVPALEGDAPMGCPLQTVVLTASD